MSTVSSVKTPPAGARLAGHGAVSRPHPPRERAALHGRRRGPAQVRHRDQPGQGGSAQETSITQSSYCQAQSLASALSHGPGPSSSTKVAQHSIICYIRTMPI